MKLHYHKPRDCCVVKDAKPTKRNEEGWEAQSQVGNLADSTDDRKNKAPRTVGALENILK